MNVADSISAFGALQGWHIIAFLFALVIIARPEWLGMVWNRILGKRNGKTNGNGDTKADAVDKRLDSHEDKCDKRQAETQAQIDRRFTKVDNELVDVRQELRKVGDKLEKSSEERSAIDAKVSNAIGKIDTMLAMKGVQS